MNTNLSLKSIKICGYKPFGDFSAEVGPLEVIAGSNGSGKTSLFEFLKFIRDSVNQNIPPEIIRGSIGQQIFHESHNEKLSWNMGIDITEEFPVKYEGELLGPIGNPRMASEQVTTSDFNPEEPYYFLRLTDSKGYEQELGLEKQPFIHINQNQLGLSIAYNPMMPTLYSLREYILGWRFYNSLNIDNDKIRRPTLIEQSPTLRENAGNLSSLLHFMMTEHRSIFDELQHVLGLAIPGFKGLAVKAYGGRGEVMAFWQEDGVDDILSLADLSDGILRFLCWAVICLQPNPPSLICIDEPDQCLHPRTLPLLAGLFEKASERTQILLATHSSYFLTQFDISRIAVMYKENGEAKFVKPKDSKALIADLDDFGVEEIEVMHKSDELEFLAR
jgi:predicted ATPase